MSVSARKKIDVSRNKRGRTIPHIPNYVYLCQLFVLFAEWDPTSAEEAELGYGQLFGAPNPLDMYPLRAGIAFGAGNYEYLILNYSA